MSRLREFTGIEIFGGTLAPMLAGFLVSEAALADEVATDLELCWRIAREDRKR